jgi:hypothetical protein
MLARSLLIYCGNGRFGVSIFRLGGEPIMAKKKAAKRELIDTGKDKRFVRRDSEGQFKESDDVGKSLSQDKKRRAKTAAKSGQGDRGDRKVK